MSLVCTRYFDQCIYRIFSIAQPNEPTNLNTTETGSDYVTLSWTNPSESGIPPFSVFVVEVISTAEPLSVMTRNASVTNTDPSFVNIFRVERLQPNTSYTARVRAVSNHPAVGDIVGTQSSNITFMTMLGGKGDVSFSLYSCLHLCRA